ncbi:hypothetical protein SanaruYs_01030 [Chryseotalea sanaruensis]|uniref:DUF4369 domain-containing protein n=1 Tax=Chryseotalea sanaruensis TaxID=2482724 RepID=A0A401U4T7_9BACT|nr:hypothetical protein [Chryseotalea sanaruensis]GCC49889.1 hypothetical protein SanaruYs_01030 [Chryseotalea sanaruensis]
MKHLFTYPLLTLFILLCNSATAQDYLITAKGDTLNGQVKIFVNGLDKRVQVSQPNKKKITYTILQVRGFVLEKEFYRPVKFADTYVFMKLLKQGYLSLYAFQMNGQLSYDGQYLLKMDGQGMEVPNLGFKRNMTRFLSECSELAAQIEEGKYGYSDLDEIINQFNACINDKTIAQSTKPKGLSNVNLDPWNALEVKVLNSALPDKNDAIDMIKDLKNKLEKGEQIPKFLSEALKAALKNDEGLTADLVKALEGL